MEIAEIIKPRTICLTPKGSEVDSTSSPLPEDELVYQRDYIGIESTLLNDTLILCLDKGKLKLVMKKHPGIPIYFPEEVEELYPYADDTELLKWVHACKKKFGKFGSWVVPRDKQTFRFTDMEDQHDQQKV